MTEGKEQETLDSIAERQKKLETGQIVLSAFVEELVEELGGNSIKSKFRSREQFIAAVAARVRQIERAGGLVIKSQQIAADRHRQAPPTILFSRANRPIL